MFSGSLDRSIRVWDLSVETPKILLALRDHTAAVTSLVLSPDGEELISGSQDDTVRIWRAAKSGTGFQER
jgi:WD40 repeat protein